MKDVLIEKADGTVEPFKVGKLKHSLTRAGASKREIEDVVQTIERELFTGMKTEAIYRRAFELLRDSERIVAAKYSLRRALFGLGPTGFPFEEYLAQLFAAEGYTTKVGTEMQGKCATHEIDLIAYRKGDCFIGEAKFHAHPGIKSDLQVALYSYARFLDLKGKKVAPKDSCGVQSYWLITNTKFTHTAIKYAECAGLTLLSWGYPKKGNLQERIEKAGLYPITVLQALSARDKRALLNQKTVLCKDIIGKPEILHSAAIPSRRINQALEESARICTIK